MQTSDSFLGLISTGAGEAQNLPSNASICRVIQSPFLSPSLQEHICCLGLGLDRGHLDLSSVPGVNVKKTWFFVLMMATWSTV